MENKTKKLVTAGMITAVVLLLGMTGLGYPAIPPLKLTIVHVPVAIGAMALGPWYGLLFGLFFGLTSMYQAAVGGLPTAPMFLDVRVALLPRLCVPLAAFWIYRLFDRMLRHRKRFISGVAGGIAASLTNTVLVLGAIYVFYGARAAGMLGISEDILVTVLLGIVLTNGLPEAGVCGILSGPILSALSHMRKEG